MQFTAAQIAMIVNGKVEGDSAAVVNSFGKIEEAKQGHLSFLANPKYEDFLYQTQASVVILANKYELKQTINATIVRVEDAYSAFATLLHKYQELKTQALTGVEQPSHVASSAKVGENVYIAAFAYISENAVIGNNVTFHAGSVIGGDGFGFAPQADGTYKKVPQIGNVVIEDYVEVGANATIDRATIGSTLIKRGAKLDNLIQIAHNVEVGNNTVIAAQAGVSGSTKLGSNVLIGGQAGIVGHISIADGSRINAQSGVSKSIKSPNTSDRKS